jgi:hypothetical protein
MSINNNNAQARAEALDAALLDARVPGATIFVRRGRVILDLSTAGARSLAEALTRGARR